MKKIINSKVNVEILTDVDDAQLRILLETSKFYIGSKQYEHFGISVLEAANAGCLPFIHDSGGQREIITPSILRFCTPLELSEKVSLLINNNTLRNETYKILQESLEKFRKDEFNKQVDTILNSLITLA